MTSTGRYSKEIGNSYLQLKKTITAHTQWELDVAAKESLRKWDELERLFRAREQAEGPGMLTGLMNHQLKRTQEQYGRILADAVEEGRQPDWDSILHNRAFPLFVFEDPEPQLEYYLSMFAVPRGRLFGLLSPSRKKIAEREEWARISYERAVEVYQVSRNAEFSLYKTRKKEFAAKQAEYNSQMLRWKAHVEQGDGLAVEKYLRVALAGSRYPSEITVEFDVFYNPILHTAVVAYRLPLPDELPLQAGFAFDADSGEISVDPMSLELRERVYDHVISQIALRAVYELFHSLPFPGILQAVALNGWVRGDSSEERTNILSLRVTRAAFEGLNLLEVEPEACLRGLGAIVAGPLARLAPVQPVLEPRSHGIHRTSLKEQALENMSWDVFRHLMEEFLLKVYLRGGGSGIEVVRVGDGGEMEAVSRSLDPDRPGDVRIRVRRKRDLMPKRDCERFYEDMTAAGAVRGVLITTGYFSDEVWEYGRDAPITLIDGPNLVHLMNEYDCHF